MLKEFSINTFLFFTISQIIPLIKQFSSPLHNFFLKIVPIACNCWHRSILKISRIIFLSDSQKDIFFLRFFFKNLFLDVRRRKMRTYENIESFS